MNIDYEKIIRNYVEPKLAYYGFKYNKEKSYPPTGKYGFTRSQWGKLQYVNISRVNYTAEDVANLIGEDDDIPTLVPQEFLLPEEPDFQLWLSNKYISVTIGQDYGGIDITRGGVGDYTPFKQLADLPFDKTRQPYFELQKAHQWWEFHDEAGLLKILNDITKIILKEGLDWFDEQVADIRRHHEKIAARRVNRKVSKKKEGN